MSDLIQRLETEAPSLRQEFAAAIRETREHRDIKYPRCPTDYMATQSDKDGWKAALKAKEQSNG